MIEYIQYQNLLMSFAYKIIKMMLININNGVYLTLKPINK